MDNYETERKDGGERGERGEIERRTKGSKLGRERGGQGESFMSPLSLKSLSFMLPLSHSLCSHSICPSSLRRSFRTGRAIEGASGPTMVSACMREMPQSQFTVSLKCICRHTVCAGSVRPYAITSEKCDAVY